MVGAQASVPSIEKTKGHLDVESVFNEDQIFSKYTNIQKTSPLLASKYSNSSTSLMDPPMLTGAHQYLYEEHFNKIFICKPKEPSISCGFRPTFSVTPSPESPPNSPKHDSFRKEDPLVTPSAEASVFSLDQTCPHSGLFETISNPSQISKCPSLTLRTRSMDYPSVIARRKSTINAACEELRELLELPKTTSKIDTLQHVIQLIAAHKKRKTRSDTE
ncbi:hypothetical protein DI09_5p240 [Mitosporidium daphniae]|uniref:BHLH domain-containing protein n=1 Tax=Mitosporidium daphniae TaxID=1485682 RepID=A0A098VNM0_9MICR|nr:uncharacterized protein DI09_5p240 [Mitosporidium daphniae]KGG50677.1 hypothetical protein DI09_5p240 [Mitosporidium daphniae]|eukprot:XP_013237104.1 uncharacterized protein DI09_5p240 [Mitosporidium daphniae]